MTAQIIDLPVKTSRPAGNGAREALLDVALGFKSTSEEDAARWCDFILAELWMRGFKVVPVE